jgi:7-cyano-7-deazaguanine synthase
METQAVVLLSGGLDSVYNLYAATQKWPGRVQALSIDYGQKAWPAEKKAAEFFSKTLQVPLSYLDLKALFLGGKSSLISSEKDIPTDEVDINSLEASEKTAEKVWVANRNGVLLNVAACVAEENGASFIVPGFNAEEAATFPDNSVDYIEKMNACLQLSTSNQVQIHCFSQSLYKLQIAQALKKQNVDFNQIWSCYYNGEKPCGRCESCQRFIRATQDL